MSWKNIWLYFFLPLLIIFIGTPLYEHVGRPVIETMPHWLVATLVDSAYASAAHDPTTVPDSIFLYIAFVVVPSFLFSMLIGVSLTRRFARIQSADLDTSTDRRHLEVLKRQALIMRRIMVGIGVTVVVGCMVTNVIVQQSLRTWRSFHANLTICAPYISESERTTLLARFAGMTTRQEYMEIAKELDDVAKGRNVSLVK